MKTVLVASLLCAFYARLFGASFRDDFVVVFIDAASEAKLGKFPLDRSLLAKAIEQAANLRAKGVVLKFFLDEPKIEMSDRALAQALTNLPVLLQARIDDAQPRSNPLPDRFTLPQLQAQAETSGQSGWIPLPQFCANASDVGFVDFSSTKVPLLESYQSRTVKSLIVCCIELAVERPAVVRPGKSLRFGRRELRVDAHNRVQAKLPAEDDLEYIPFHQFVRGDLPESQIKGKIVVIGYDGPELHSLSTVTGPLRAHRFFVYVLRSIYEQLGS